MPSWVPLGNPNLPAGQAPSAASAPVVIANDDIVSTDLEQDRVLHDIAGYLAAIAGAKGVAADLRVFVDNFAVSTLAGVTTVAALTNLAQIGALSANAMIQNLQNTSYSNAFSQNIVRP